MNPKLQILLVAFGFAALGSGATWLGHRLADPNGAAVGASSDDSSPQRERRAGRVGRRGPPDRARGQSAGPGGGPGAGHGWAALARGLDLSADQRRTWVAALQKVRSTCGVADPGPGGMALDLLEAMSAAPAEDPESLHRLLDERVEAQRTAAHCALTEVQGFVATLTPEQRAALADRLGQIEARRRSWVEGWSP